MPLARMMITVNKTLITVITTAMNVNNDNTGGAKTYSSVSWIKTKRNRV